MEDEYSNPLVYATINEECPKCGNPETCEARDQSLDCTTVAVWCEKCDWRIPESEE